ncbi:MAG TPA: VWA domain-containing protein, partial [Roseiflexaceae bacterium]
MPHLSFITPAALALLALLPLMWALTLAAPRRIGHGRFWLSLAIRSAILVALVLGLAGAQLVRPMQALTTVFLVDASDSVAPAQRDRATQYVDEALREMPAGDRAAVVVFGANALVERTPASLAALGRVNSVPVTTRTNIQDAVQLGLALLPADSQKRLVLLSDGGENSGHAADAARLAAARGVPLDVVALPSERGADVLVSALNAPSLAREGQEIALAVAIRSTIATIGRLQVFVDGQLVGEQGVTLAPGLTSVPVRVPAGTAGFRRLEVRVDAQGDTEPQNNRAAAFTEVQGPPRMLLIASDASRAANLKAALESAGVRVDLRAPDQAPASLAQLSSYAAVVLVDTPAREVPRALLEALPAYVRELGRGLAMIGGVDSFGAGGYRRAVADQTGASIEDALPVNLDPPDIASQPNLALAMVIDRSGSMDEPGGGSRTKLDLAKEAVYQASLGLSQRDQIGLIVFDDAADTVLPLQKLPPAIAIEQVLSGFGSGGGT